MTSMRIHRILWCGAALLASGAIFVPLGIAAAQDAPPSCIGCDSSAEARADRELADAMARLESAQQAMADAMKLAMTARDSTGASAEALARANGQLRRAQERFAAVTNELLRRRMALERVDMDRVTQAVRAAAGIAGDMPGYLGVTFSASTRDVQQQGGKVLMRFDGYPTIESVDPDSPAERAGVEAGDKLLALDGKDVTVGCEPFSTLLKPGSHLRLRVKRGSDSKQLSALIARRPASSWAQVWTGPTTIRVNPSPALPAQPLVALAPRSRTQDADSTDVEVMVAPLTMSVMPRLNGSSLSVVAGAEVMPVGNLADYFGVNQGVLVLRVESGTVAARSGLQDGDVIVSAGGRDVATPSAFSRAVYRASDFQLQLEILRLKKKKSILLK
ncbi:MAG: PDZ domain-containing protein, partial [Gemmatimonadaceae bacterium]